MLKKWSSRWLLLLFGNSFLFVGTLSGQSDTLLHSYLDSLIVIGYDSEQMLRSVPGAVHVLSEERLRAFDDERIFTCFNSLHGVRYQERSPGSYPLSIRGSTLRAPFGDRNIKVSWNGNPFTDPTASTSL